MRDPVDQHLTVPLSENITGTIQLSPDLVIIESDKLYLCGYSGSPRCSYVEAEDWHYGDASPFCDAPTVPGSSYCARHKALCHLAPGAEAATPPAEPGQPDPPEPLIPTEPEEVLPALDLPPRPAGSDED
jgi:hypothetical protein